MLSRYPPRVIAFSAAFVGLMGACACLGAVLKTEYDGSKAKQRQQQLSINEQIHKLELHRSSFLRNKQSLEKKRKLWRPMINDNALSS